MSIKLPSNILVYEHPVEIIPTIYSAYSPRKLKADVIFYPENDMAQQEFKDESDINSIMKQYMNTGIIEWVNKHEATFGDGTGAEFQSAMEKIASAQSMFNELPSALRAEFDNDPAQFLDFVSDPANRSEMADLGLLTPQGALNAKIPVPTPPEPAPTAPAASKLVDTKTIPLPL